MKRVKFIIFCTAFMMMLTVNAGAVESLVETVVKGCETELTSYCNQVTPGEGRVLACLYSYGDKISGKCEYALYDAAAQLERFISALTYVVNECEDDLVKYCASVPAGDGRLAECLLEKNKDKISDRCNRAVQDVKLKYEK